MLEEGERAEPGGCSPLPAGVREGWQTVVRIVPSTASRGESSLFRGGGDAVMRVGDRRGGASAQSSGWRDSSNSRLTLGLECAPCNGHWGQPSCASCSKGEENKNSAMQQNKAQLAPHQALCEFFEIPTKVPLVLGMEDDKRGLVAIVCWRGLLLNIPKEKLEG